MSRRTERAPVALLASGVVAAVSANVLLGRALCRRCSTREDALAHAVTGRTSPARDRVGIAASWLTDVPRAIGITAGVVVVTGLVTKDARRAALPGVATALASAMHVATSLMVGRVRPRGERMGTEQITSSYPSGHVGAATAQAIVLAHMASSLPDGPRQLARCACVVAPLLVGWSRLYTGHHHPSDVIAGYANGAIAATAARRAMRR